MCQRKKQGDYCLDVIVNRKTKPIFQPAKMFFSKHLCLAHINLTKKDLFYLVDILQH